MLWRENPKMEYASGLYYSTEQRIKKGIATA